MLDNDKDRLGSLIKELPICNRGKSVVKKILELVIKQKIEVPFVIGGLYKADCIKPNLLSLRPVKIQVELNKYEDGFEFYRLEDNSTHRIIHHRKDFDKECFDYSIIYIREKI